MTKLLAVGPVAVAFSTTAVTPEVGTPTRPGTVTSTPGGIQCSMGICQASFAAVGAFATAKFASGGMSVMVAIVLAALVAALPPALAGVYGNPFPVNVATLGGSIAWKTFFDHWGAA